MRRRSTLAARAATATPATGAAAPYWIFLSAWRGRVWAAAFGAEAARRRRRRRRRRRARRQGQSCLVIYNRSSVCFQTVVVVSLGLKCELVLTTCQNMPRLAGSPLDLSRFFKQNISSMFFLNPKPFRGFSAACCLTLKRGLMAVL